MSLTSAGRKLSTLIYEALRDMEATPLRGCPAADLAAFSRVIERLTEMS